MTRILRVVVVSAMLTSINNSAFSSSTSPGIIKPEIGSLVSRMDIPPKVVYDRIALGADLDEIYVLVGNFSKTGDKVSILAEDSEKKKIMVVWEWNFEHPASGEQSGELAILKVFTNCNKVWAISLEHVILNNGDIERRIFERKSLDFIAEHEKK